MNSSPRIKEAVFHVRQSDMMGATTKSSLLWFFLNTVSGFHISTPTFRGITMKSYHDSFQEHERKIENEPSRRQFIHAITSTCALVTGLNLFPEPTRAAIGTLPEFGDTNAMIQGITVNVADKSQEEAMVNFLVNGFDFKVLRRRIVDSVEDTVR